MRGYYVILNRTPTWDLSQWQDAMDSFADDGAEAVILWVPGGFRSRRYPETWQYNTEHKNVHEDFVRTLIDYAHTKNIKILLGFSPFAYDGVNQYPFTHPETRGKNPDNSPIAEAGMACFGPALCPNIEESQRFMLDYITEMTDDFYPNADGLFIESSDYNRCQCDSCKISYYRDEFRFVRAMSDHFWAARPDAPIVVYPHYFVRGSFSTDTVKSVGGGEAFDNRWSLFFTPHSTDVHDTETRELMTQARENLIWDTALIMGSWRDVQKGAQTARDLGGDYFPSLEGYSYVGTRIEHDFDPHVVGHRLKPRGLEWLPDGVNHYHDPIIRLNRIAFREFTKSPDLNESDFAELARRELFTSQAGEDSWDDLCFLSEAVMAAEGSWYFASPVVLPARLFALAKIRNWSDEKVSGYRAQAERIRIIAHRYEHATDPTERDMYRAAAFIARKWEKYPSESKERES